MSCIICLDKTNEHVINTSCCMQSIHQTCLNQWFNESASLGRCPHCRRQLDRSCPLINLLNIDEDAEVMHRWRNPYGIINITNGNGGVGVIIEPEHSYHICSYRDFEHESVSDDEHIIILTNDNGEYADTLNIPTGWLLNVNNSAHSLQLSTYLRLEP